MHHVVCFLEMDSYAVQCNGAEVVSLEQSWLLCVRCRSPYDRGANLTSRCSLSSNVAELYNADHTCQAGLRIWLAQRQQKDKLRSLPNV
jgi:hypothetical protein